MKTLVLTRSDSKYLPLDIRVGWRIICQSGEPYDLIWGSCLPQGLDSLIADMRVKNKEEIQLLDLRETPDLLRDKKYYDNRNATGNQP